MPSGRLLAATVALLLGCPQPTPPPSRQAVVEITSPGAAPSLIYADEFKAALARKRLNRSGSLQAEPLPAALKKQLLEALIEERLVAQEARREKVSASTTAVAAEMAALHRGLPPGKLERELVRTYQKENDLKRAIEARLLRAALLEPVFAKLKKPTEAELKEAFSRMPVAQKIRPERVRAAQIVVRTEAEGKKLLLKLLRGRIDFAEAAKKLSLAPEGERGGDLGWFERGVMPRFFDEVCFSLKPGQISSPTASNYGFHLFKVTGHEPPRPLRFEEAKPRLETELMEKRLRKAESDYLKTLRYKVRVLRHEDLISKIE